MWWTLVQVNSKLNIIGYKDITIVRNVLLLKEKIDEQRGERNGQYKVQQSIKQALGID